MASQTTAGIGLKPVPREDASVREQVPNAPTRAAIEEARNRKNLTRHRDARELMARYVDA